MSKKAIAIGLVGVVLLGVGVLWVLQGADVVHVRPVLCVSACKPVTGGSVGWFVAGVIAVLVGVAMIVASTRRARRA